MHEADELLARVRAGAARRRRAGTQDRTQAYLRATSLVGLDDQPATYWAGRAHPLLRARRPGPLRRGVHRLVPRQGPPGRTAAAGPAQRSPRPSSTPATAAPVTAPPTRSCCGRWPATSEVLRHRDIADMATRREGPARGDVRGPAPAPAAAARPPPYAVAPRRRRRPAHPAADAPADGGAGRDRLAAPRRAPAPAGAAGRRLRLDERLRGRAAAARAPQPPGRGRRPTRGVHPSAPGSPGSPGRCGCATPTGPSSRPARRCPTGPAAPGWVRGCRLPRPLGAARAWPAAPWSWCSATAGSAATPPCSASRCAGCTGSPTGRLGQPAPGQGGLPARAAGIVAALPLRRRPGGGSLAGRPSQDLVEVVADA